MKRAKGTGGRALTLPERMQVRRAARSWGRTRATFERLARAYGVPADTIREVVIG
jgi:membrane-bound lytic murein transglycosylase B